MLFDNWLGLVRTVIVGTLAYYGAWVLLRISGKRTLSKMNAFNLVVTVALGSSLAIVLLSKQTAPAEGVVALALLVFLQFTITWLSARFNMVSRRVKAEPRLLLCKGEVLGEAIKDERMNANEVLQAVRSQNYGSLDEVGAVVLETDGSFSVLPHAQLKSPSTAANVAGGEQSR